MWVGTEPDGGAAVVLRADARRCWYVHGWVARDALLRVAASLPTV